jgi:uncharacterized membrane protein (UPF0127 family)
LDLRETAMCGRLIPMRRSTLTLETAFGTHAIHIEIPETAAEQQAGLKFRANVPERTGMLFLYGVGQEVTMWMKDTRVSLDMVFIRADGRVHRIEAQTEPLSHTVVPSRGPVVAVLELAAGSAGRLGLKPGDRAVHPAFTGTGRV